MANNWSDLLSGLMNRMAPGGGGGAPQMQQEPQMAPRQQMPSTGSLMEHIVQALQDTPSAIQGAQSPYFIGSPSMDLANIMLHNTAFRMAPSRRDLEIAQAEQQLQDQNNRVEEVRRSLAGKTQKVEQKNPEAFARALGDAVAAASTNGKMQFAMKGNDVVPFENNKKGSYSKSTQDSGDMWSKGFLGEDQARLAKGIGADVFEAAGIPKEAAKQIAELTKGQRPTVEGLLKLFMKENGANDQQSFDAILKEISKNDMPQQEDFWPLFLGRFHNSQSPDIQDALTQVQAARERQKEKKR